MPGIFVGDEDCIELEDGVRCYILHDLSQGADDDLAAYARAQGGDADTIWGTKLIELAITRIVPPGGQEYKPTWEELRQLKRSVSSRLTEEIMTRWFPLGWANIQALMAAAAETTAETTSGERSTGTEG